MLPLPSYDSQFITLFESGEGYVRRHVAVDISASDYGYLEEVAIEKAKMGMQVDIMPTLQDDDPLRNLFFPDAFGFKCPDLRIDGILWEVKRSSNSTNMNNVKHAIDEARKQAGYVIISLSHEIDQDILLRLAVGRFKDHENLMVIEFRYKGIYSSYYK